ncbi:type II toxin-antitoxin system Phd/YefM family antitoxin [Arachnia propionica]|uniref:Prevent-host-death protein n=1 Tax=Arachnia propionica TaxID=1750 RepID=A0A3P1WYC6_9ACTN|nr:hypothetical protein [Arachnia propionica]RRD49413.1 hypothetical protein EII35_08595 [Arachnia propionica]
MRTVTKRELNQNTAATLQQVDDDNDVIVTERGRPRWRISTVNDFEATLLRLEREGRYTPPSPNPPPWPDHPGGPAYTDAEVEELLREMRGDH